jgi:hypothetical protein
MLLKDCSGLAHMQRASVEQWLVFVAVTAEVKSNHRVSGIGGGLSDVVPAWLPWRLNCAW